MSVEKAGDSLRWYAVYTNPRQEDRVESILKTLDIDIFLPRLKDRRCNASSHRPAYVIKPLFPRYIFAHFNMRSLLRKVRFTRGVHSVVSFGNEPTPVDDQIIAIIRSQIGQDGFVKLGERLQTGDKVLVGEGPFKGFGGIFEREAKDIERIVILLNAVSYQARVVIPRALVKKVS